MVLNLLRKIFSDGWALYGSPASSAECETVSVMLGQQFTVTQNFYSTVAQQGGSESQGSGLEDIWPLGFMVRGTTKTMQSQEQRKPERRETGGPAHKEGQVTWPMINQRGLVLSHPASLNGIKLTA